MEKITIQYFINKELNPRIENGKPTYPVYVQVITLRKNLRFKSNNHFFEYLSEDELKNEFVQNILKKEDEVIEYIVRDLIRQEKRDLVTSKNLSLFSQNLHDTIDDNFPKFLLQEYKETKKNTPDIFVPNILFSASYTDIREIKALYNNDNPIRISENVEYCLDAAEALYYKTIEKLFYVYDLFYGDKKKELESEIYTDAIDEREVEIEINKKISILQKLVLL
jgi:hypothetical protein